MSTQKQQGDTATFPYREKSVGIADDLRRRITGGEYRNGQRLPTRAEMRQAYGVTSTTVQRALDSLMDEGFVESAGRRGTFVSETPPHLTNYALLFPNRFLPQEPSNRFYHGLYLAAQQLGGTRKIKICDGFTGRSGFLDYETLIDDMRQNRLAGILFASAPFTLDDTPLLADDGMPRTAFMSHSRYPHIPAVRTDSAGFRQLAAERLHAAGCRRVAVFANARLPEADVSAMRQTLQGYDLLPDADLFVGMSIDRPDWCANLIRLIFRAPADQQPDGLLIADDHLVEPVTRAVAALNLPHPLPIVAHSNPILPPPSPVPVIRLGFDIPAILDAMLHNIDRLRQGQQPAAVTSITPHFDTANTLVSTPS